MAMKLAWLTDTHLNFIDGYAREKYYQEIIDTECDGVFLTGDIAEAPCLIDILSEMSSFIQKPIYFVLGNHDYYRGQVETVKATMVTLTQKQPQLIWMNTAGVLPLNESTLLVGQDGWADGRLGDYQKSRVQLNDSRMIADLMQANIFGKFKLLDKMQELADIDAAQLNKDLQITQKTVAEARRKVNLISIEIAKARRSEGWPWNELAKLAEAGGRWYPRRRSFKLIRSVLKKGIPVILDVNGNRRPFGIIDADRDLPHVIVAIGFTKTHLLYLDSGKGPTVRKILWKTFSRLSRKHEGEALFLL